MAAITKEAIYSGSDETGAAAVNGGVPVTLLLSQKTQTLLRDQAEQRGLEISSLADELLHDALSEFEETVAGIQRGVDAALKGDEMDFEQFVKLRQEQRRLANDVRKAA